MLHIDRMSIMSSHLHYVGWALPTVIMQWWAEPTLLHLE